MDFSLILRGNMLRPTINIFIISGQFIRVITACDFHFSDSFGVSKSYYLSPHSIEHCRVRFLL